VRRADGSRRGDGRVVDPAGLRGTGCVVLLPLDLHDPPLGRKLTLSTSQAHDASSTRLRQALARCDDSHDLGRGRTSCVNAPRPSCFPLSLSLAPVLQNGVLAQTLPQLNSVHRSAPTCRPPSRPPPSCASSPRPFPACARPRPESAALDGEKEQRRREGTHRAALLALDLVLQAQALLLGAAAMRLDGSGETRRSAGA